MPEFIPGLELAKIFYDEHVSVLLDGVPHAAALLGEGSEVLGCDTERSTDHAWGPRLQVFVAEDRIQDVEGPLAEGLPVDVRGWPARFFRWQTGDVRHHVEVLALGAWLVEQLGFDPRDGVSTSQWLALPQQSLLHVTAGAVFHDDTGDLTGVRDALEWYPRDVWVWMMASAWQRVQDVEHVVGRTAEIPDELGNEIVVAKLVRYLMSLCFLQERRYAPYVKWFGRAFTRLEAAGEVGPLVSAALAGDTAAARSDAVAEALEGVARRHNRLGVTPHVDPVVGPFDVKINDAVRPFRVLNANRFVTACSAAVEDEALRALPPVGSIDQLVDVNDLVTNFTDWPRDLEAVYARKLA